MDASTLDSLDTLINDQVTNALAFYTNVSGKVPTPTVDQLQYTPPPALNSLTQAAVSDPWSIGVLIAIIVGGIIIVKNVV